MKYAIWRGHKVEGYAELPMQIAQELNVECKGGCYFGFDAETIAENGKRAALMSYALENPKASQKALKKSVSEVRKIIDTLTDYSSDKIICYAIKHLCRAAEIIELSDTAETITGYCRRK